MATLERADLLDLYRLLAKTRWLNGVLARLRSHIFGVAILSLRQESVPVVPMFVLLKMGILLDSIKSGDHRTNFGIATVTDELTAHLEGHNHTMELLRNHFGKATGGNRGRDGNVHYGCLECRILQFMVSDMGRMPGIALGYAQEIARIEYPSLDPANWPIGVTFFGEGAFQQGGIYEAMNECATGNHKLTMEKLLARVDEQFITPFMREYGVVRPSAFTWFVNKNRYSLFADAIEEHGDSNLAMRATGFGDMVGIEVDADNPVEYYRVCHEAFTRAREEFVSTIVVANTYRGGGHNQDEIAYEPGALERGDFAAVTRVDGVDDLGEFKEAWKTEPLIQLRKYMLDQDVADESTLDAIYAEQEASMTELAQQVLAEPDITVEEDKKDRTIFPPIDWSSLPLEKPHVVPGIRDDESRVKWMAFNESYTWIVDKLLSEDPGVVYFGQDIAKGPGGVLGLTPGLAKKFGPGRVWQTPIAEEAMFAGGAGRSLFVPRPHIVLPEGYKKSKPIVEAEFAHFLWDGMIILRVVAPQWYQKGMKFGFIAILPAGPLPGGGEYHESVEIFAHLMKMQGIVILMPTNAYDLVGLMRAAYEYDGPVAVYLQISARNNWEFGREIPLDPYVIPFGKAKIITETQNPTVTVVPIGAGCTRATENEASHLKDEDGIEVEIVDLRTAWPFDLATIKKSFFRTGQLVIIQEDTLPGSIGATIESMLTKDEEVQRHFAKDLITDIGEGLGFLERLLTTRIHVISSGEEGDIFSPTAENLVWARLPYVRVEEEGIDETGQPHTPLIHRSPKLAAVIRAQRQYR